MQFIVTLVGKPSALLILPDAGREGGWSGFSPSIFPVVRCLLGLGYSYAHLPALFHRELVIFVLYLLSIC